LLLAAALGRKGAADDPHRVRYRPEADLYPTPDNAA
jgi:hypothetical protein